MSTIAEDLAEATELRKLARRPGVSSSAKRDFERAAIRVDSRAGRKARRLARPKKHASNKNLR